MHLLLNQELLVKATDFVAKAADKHHRFVILGNIKLELTKQTLILTASDLEVELVAVLDLPDGACLETGATTLPAAKFNEICKSLPKTMVEIKADNDICFISADQSQFRLTVLSAADYPSIGTPKPQKNITIRRQDLHSLITHTRFCMATQDVRHYLTGLLLHVNGDTLTGVATEGHRLAVAKYPLDNHYDDTQIIVPGKAVAELERLFGELQKKLGNDDDKVTLGLDDEFLQVTLDFGQSDDTANTAIRVSLIARLIDGKFPDYSRVLPTNTDRTAYFDKDTMMNTLRRVSILSNERWRGVVMDFDDNNVTIRCNNSDGGEAKETLSIRYEGEPLELSLNETYLKSVLGVLNGEVQIKMSDAYNATLICQVDDDKHQYVVMPMRL